MLYAHLVKHPFGDFISIVDAADGITAHQQAVIEYGTRAQVIPLSNKELAESDLHVFLIDSAAKD